uniref:Uncharacterized protein n=1 Tax=Glossina palpalis gambiensis TaxID=67801 RepID=A0A1B0AUZ9_9MUSC
MAKHNAFYCQRTQISINAKLTNQMWIQIVTQKFRSSRQFQSTLIRRTQGEVFTNAIELAEEEIEDSSDNTFASALYRSPTVENTDLISVEDDTPLLSFEDESQPIEHYPINKKKNSESVKYVDNFLESYIAEDSTEEAKEANELHTMTTKTLSEKNLLTKSGKDAKEVLHICKIGYEKCREISVRREFSLDGKDKYLINGRTVHRKRLAKFFTSIRLNIENPNFLIRNECITKSQPRSSSSTREYTVAWLVYASSKWICTILSFSVSPANFDWADIGGLSQLSSWAGAKSSWAGAKSSSVSRARFGPCDCRRLAAWADVDGLS